MYAQFFGNFLLNSKIITPQQLAEAIELKKTTRLKLGVLAINAGYMNSEQVESVHKMQQRVDKRIGDIAVELGYMTTEQVDNLLSAQKTGYLLLGQALVDKGYMSNSQFEAAINEYKSKYKVSDKDLSGEHSESIKNLITEFYHFGAAEGDEACTEYATLMFKNIVRFIGDDFTPLEVSIATNFKCENIVTQNIEGKISFFTALEANDDAFVGFASRFAEEQLEPNTEMTDAAMGEFLNLQNGLFTVNMSNDKEIELELTPQVTEKNISLSLEASVFCVPLVFPFGTINFIIGTK